MRRSRKKIISLTLICVGLMAAFCIYFFYGLENQFQKSTQSLSIAQSKKNNLNVSRQTIERGRFLMSQLPENSKKSESAIKFMMGMMEDRAFSLFFNYTLEFFGDISAAYPAARFVGLTLLFDDSEENYYLRSWTQRDLTDYSEEIMKVLESRVKEIDINPYFHSRMLNLVFQLNVSSQRKFDFFADSLVKPLVLNSLGELADESLSFETALILSAQSKIKSSDIAPVITKSLALNSDEPKKMEALKMRVNTYYPELRYLFRD